MQCEQIKADGKRCKAAAVTGSELCFTHEPSMAAKRAEARKRGGYNRQTKHGGQVATVPENIRSMDDVLCLLDYATAETLAQENGVQRGRLLVAIAAEFRQAIQATEFEQRLVALEEAVYGFPR